MVGRCLSFVLSCGVMSSATCGKGDPWIFTLQRSPSLSSSVFHSVLNGVFKAVEKTKTEEEMRAGQGFTKEVTKPALVPSHTGKICFKSCPKDKFAWLYSTANFYWCQLPHQNGQCLLNFDQCNCKEFASIFHMRIVFTIFNFSTQVVGLPLLCSLHW